MKPKESFALRWQDLVIMSRDKTKITSVKTFDKQVGRVTKDGMVLLQSLNKKIIPLFQRTFLYCFK